MNEAHVTFDKIKSVPALKWKKLSQKKIYFGHQSVGYNIIDGIKDIMKAYPEIKLDIVNVNHPFNFEKPMFAHCAIGRNMDPRSKINAFADAMAKGIGNKADIAFFKFCYLDISHQTNVPKLFKEYKLAMSGLIEQYPKTTFAHFTVPLTQKQTGLKAWIKKLLGKPTVNAANVKRNEFNKLLLAEYSGKAPVFDLAKIESTFADGSRSTFNINGKTYYSMAPELTNDGGHLNNYGRKKLAAQFLLMLSNLSDT